MTTSGIPVMGAVTACKHYLNKSVESMCDTHKTINSQMSMNRIRSTRNMMHSDFIDLNCVRKQFL